MSKRKRLDEVSSSSSSSSESEVENDIWSDGDSTSNPCSPAPAALDSSSHDDHSSSSSDGSSVHSESSCSHSTEKSSGFSGSEGSWLDSDAISEDEVFAQTPPRAPSNSDETSSTSCSDTGI